MHRLVGRGRAGDGVSRTRVRVRTDHGLGIDLVMDEEVRRPVGQKRSTSRFRAPRF